MHPNRGDRQEAEFAHPHFYDLREKTWICSNCRTDCGRDEIPCRCCFDDLPVITPRNEAQR